MCVLMDIYTVLQVTTGLIRMENRMMGARDKLFQNG